MIQFLWDIFLETCPFHLGCPIFGTVYSIFYILKISTVLVISPLSFLIWFGSFLFSFWWAWPEVCWFCLPFQRLSSWFHWLFFFFFNLYFIYSLIFIFFLLLVLDCLFFFFLQVDYLRFSLFSEQGLYDYELPSKDCF